MSNRNWLDELIPEAPEWARDLIAERLDERDKAMRFCIWMDDRPQIFIGAIGREMLKNVLRSSPNE